MNEAVETFSVCIEKFPDYYFGYYKLGVLFSKMNNYDLAEQVLKRGLDLKPTDHNIMIHLGNVNLN
jgi:tetratricopeptide (TPR) repeat protein